MAHEPILPGLQPINIYSILPTVLLFHVRLNGQPAAIGGGQAHRIRLNSYAMPILELNSGVFSCIEDLASQEDQSQGSRETDPGGHAKGVSRSINQRLHETYTDGSFLGRPPPRMQRRNWDIDD
ncbi:uncharacterized protein CIMG_10999 [Coccidioides immitis RS]|uniref:Uncharacterized protein n=1 Tax=Coccidioides immitis (strain RS) TaxID=246410 RepID=A0A0D8JS63_COCIM|nr:uncharacterized protein CIMG_10999 [Coccidioides immitis RS]KJF59974.1 hypothetical protein CIMG_10999 [Coccidioides immitis RS]